MLVGSKVKWAQGRGFSTGKVESVEGEIALVIAEKTGKASRRKIANLELLEAPPEIATVTKKTRKKKEEAE